MKTVACVRCGLCCLTSICISGRPNKRGICEYLTIHRNLSTSCKLIYQTPHINTGCTIRANDAIISAYLKTYNLKKILAKARRQQIYDYWAGRLSGWLKSIFQKSI